MLMCNKGYCKSWADDYVGMHMPNEECPACKSIEQKAKEWFGHSEHDTDLMIAMGVISQHQIIEMYRREVLKEPA